MAWGGTRPSNSAMRSFVTRSTTSANLSGVRACCGKVGSSGDEAESLTNLGFSSHPRLVYRWRSWAVGVRVSPQPCLAVTPILPRRPGAVVSDHHDDARPVQDRLRLRCVHRCLLGREKSEDGPARSKGPRLPIRSHVDGPPR